MAVNLQYYDYFRTSVGWGLQVTGVGNTAAAGVTIGTGTLYYASGLGTGTPNRYNLATPITVSGLTTGKDTYIDWNGTTATTTTVNIGAAAPALASGSVRLARVTVGPMSTPSTPTASIPTSSTIGSIPTGTFYAVTTAVGPGGLESAPSSASATQNVTLGNLLQIQGGAFPTGAEYLNVYVGTSGGPAYLQGRINTTNGSLTLSSYAASGLQQPLPSAPAGAPTLTASTTTGASILPGTYSVVTTLVTASGGESVASPPTSVTVSSPNNTLTIQPGTFTAAYANVYAALSPGGPYYLQGQVYTSGGSLVLTALTGSTQTPPTSGLSIVAAITDLRPFSNRPGDPLSLNILDFGADPTGATDSSGSIVDALQVLAGNAPNNGLTTSNVAPYSAGGGTLYFPPGTYLVKDQITIPNSLGATPVTQQSQAQPLQAPIRLTGAGPTGSTIFQNTSKLDLRYGGSGVGGKITTLGYGRLEIDHLNIVNGQSATDTTPFLYVTNTRLNFHDNSVAGGTLVRTSDPLQNYLYLGLGALMDAIQLGGTDQNHLAYDGTLNSNFEGYVTSIERNLFNNCRRIVATGFDSNTIVVASNGVSSGCNANPVVRGSTANTSAPASGTVTLNPGPPVGSFVVGSVVTYDIAAAQEVVVVTALTTSAGAITSFTANFAKSHNAGALLVWQPAGGSILDSVWAACVDVRNAGQTTIRDNQIECSGWNSGIRAGPGGHMSGNGIWDPGFTIGMNAIDIAPATYLTGAATLSSNSSTSAVPSTGYRTVTFSSGPASTAFTVGSTLACDTGVNQEFVQVTAVTTSGGTITSFTGLFTKTHAAGFSVGLGSLTTAGYINTGSQTADGIHGLGTWVLLDSDPTTSLSAAVQPGAVSGTSGVITVSDYSTINLGDYLGFLDTLPNGQPNEAVREWVRVTVQPTSSTITIDHPVNNPHPAGVPIVILKGILPLNPPPPLTAQVTTPLVFNGNGTLLEGSSVVLLPSLGLITTGSVVSTVDIDAYGNRLTGLTEYFLVTGVTSSADANGNYAVMLDHPAMYNHGVGHPVQDQIQADGTTTVANGAQFVVGFPVTVGSQTGMLTGISGNTLTVSLPAATHRGDYVYQIQTIPYPPGGMAARTCGLAVHELVKIANEPTATKIASLQAYVPAGATGGVAPSIPVNNIYTDSGNTQQIAVGASICLQESFNPPALSAAAPAITGTYYALITYVNAGGQESTAGPVSAAFSPVSNQNLTVATGTFPAGVHHANVYLGTSSTGPFYLQGQEATSGGTLAVGAYKTSGLQPPPAAPGTAPGLAPGGAGTLSGTYYAVTTFVGQDGIESPPSPEASQTISSQTLSVTAQTFPSNVQSANVYVGTTTGGPYFLQGSIAASGGSVTLTTYANTGAQPPPVAPSSAPSASASGTGGTIPTGTYYAVATYVGLDGIETAASAASAGTAVTLGQNLTLTAPTPPAGSGVQSANLYVGTSASGPFYLHGSATVAGSWQLTLASYTTATPMPPPAAPTATPSLSSASSSLAGTYYVVTTFVAAGSGSESYPSRTSFSVSVPSGSDLLVTVPSFPAHVQYANVYVGTSSTGPFYLQGQQFASGGTLYLGSYTASGPTLPTVPTGNFMTPWTYSSEWFTVTGVVPGTFPAGTLLLNRAPEYSHGQNSTNVLYGPFTYTDLAIQQSHPASSRVRVASVASPKYYPRAGESLRSYYFMSSGFSEEPFQVLGLESRLPSATTTLQGPVQKNFGSPTIGYLRLASSIAAGSYLRIADTTRANQGYGVAQEMVLASTTNGTTVFPSEAPFFGAQYAAGAQVMGGPFNLIITPITGYYSGADSLATNFGVVAEWGATSNVITQPGVEPRPVLDLDGRNSIVEGDDSALVRSAGMLQGGWGVATRVQGHRPNDEDFLHLNGVGPMDGLMIVDGSTGTLWLRVGGTWQPIASTLGATPSVVAGPALGTSPPAPLLASGSSDRRGQILLGTGSSPSSGVAATVTFSTPFTTPPLVLLTWGSTAASPPPLAATLVGSAGVWTGFAVNVLGPNLTASQPAGTYVVNYSVLG